MERKLCSAGDSLKMNGCVCTRISVALSFCHTCLHHGSDMLSFSLLEGEFLTDFEVFRASVRCTLAFYLCWKLCRRDLRYIVCQFCEVVLFCSCSSSRLLCDVYSCPFKIDAAKINAEKRNKRKRIMRGLAEGGG